MSLDVHIGTLESRYHLPPQVIEAGAPDQAARLDHLWRQTLEESLPTVLARLGVGSDEVVCLRHLHVPVALALNAGASSQIERWSQALAVAVDDAMNADQANETAIVRYRNPVAAVVDFARQVTSGDFARAWTWRRLGFCTETGAATGVATSVDAARRAEAVIVACERRPEATLPVVLSLAATPGRLARLVTDTVAVDGWTRLARAAWTVAGGDADAWSTVDVTATTVLTGGADDALVTAPARALVQAAHARPDVLVEDLAARRATAALVLLAVDPGAARVVPSVPGQADKGAHSSSHRPALGSLLAAMCATLVGEGTATGNDGRPVSVAPPDGTTPGGTTPEGTPREIPEIHANGAPRTRRETSDGGIAGSLRRPTRWGGLLFLVHLLHDSPLLDAMAGSTLARRHGLRWCLFVLARSLVEAAPGGVNASEAGVPAHDPALLAFTGLGPDAELPDHGRPLTRSAGRVVRVWAAAVRAMLLARVPSNGAAVAHAAVAHDAVAHDAVAHDAVAHDAVAHDAVAHDAVAHDAVVRTCRRRGVLVTDPGWIELRLPLGSVALPVRRAGLDLDPGWVPWLGVVIKITYTAEATL